MRRYLAVFLTAALTCAGLAVQAADPAVTNVRAEQRRGTPYVDITYDLADADTAALDVTVAVSTNGGAAYFIPSSGLSGDTGSGVARGTARKIVWNAGAALPPKLYSNVRARVTVSDSPVPEGMVLIPAGTNIGTDYSYEYSLTVETFYMDVTEVTKAQWDAVYTWAVAHGYTFAHAGSGKASNHPVHTVSWYDCVKWCNARSQKDGRTPCYNLSTWTCNFAANGYRLPTYTEWSYAMRGGLSGRRFPWGDTIDHSRANYHGYPQYYPFDLGYEGCDTRYSTGDYPYTSPAGAFEANGYGLYDMTGNVWEWQNDALWVWFYGTETSFHTLHGGSWSSEATPCNCQAATYPDIASNDFGFRAVCR